MRLVYISPSSLPSRSANSVHVMLQCDAFASMGVDVTLFAKRTTAEESSLEAELQRAYGVDASRFTLRTYHSSSMRADVAKIAGMALASKATRTADIVLSRNLYAAFGLGVIGRRRLLFETHQLELGFRKRMQRAIMLRKSVTTVAISKKLVECLTEHHGVEPSRCVILHDAAPAGIQRVPVEQRRRLLSSHMQQDLAGWSIVCGYFGQLHPGRGIEVIEQVADRARDCLFLIFGGSERDIEQRRRHNTSGNLRYMGHVPHARASELMRTLDVLLMPYQESVSIGIAGHDTARWMSPMKMFEYMASGAAIVSSDLPVLREVLVDERNCLLAPPSDATRWAACVARLAADVHLRERLGGDAHEDYARSHTWALRAKALLAAGAAL